MFKIKMEKKYNQEFSEKATLQQPTRQNEPP